MATAAATRTPRRAADPAARRWWLLSWALRLATVAGLAVDAWVHAELATRYDPNQAPGGLSQGDLFRAEAVVSVTAAAVLLFTPRLLAWLLAWLVAASALAGLLLYRYHDPGAIGPLPDMYEPLWFPEKSVAGAAEALALGTASVGLLLHGWFLAGARPRLGRRTVDDLDPSYWSVRRASLTAVASTSARRVITHRAALSPRAVDDHRPGGEHGRPVEEHGRLA